MNRPVKYLSYTLLFVFCIWMSLIHEPRKVLPDPVEGIIQSTVSNENVSVRLENGQQVIVTAPRQLPKTTELKVKLEVTEYKWTGKRRYTIINWKSH